MIVHLLMRIVSESEDAFSLGPVRGTLTKILVVFLGLRFHKKCVLRIYQGGILEIPEPSEKADLAQAIRIAGGFELLGRTGCEAHPFSFLESLSACAARSTSQVFSWPSVAAQLSAVFLVDGGVHYSKVRRTTRDHRRRVNKIKSPFTF